VQHKITLQEKTQELNQKLAAIQLELSLAEDQNSIKKKNE